MNFYKKVLPKKSEREIQRKTKMKECSPFLFQKSILKSPIFSIFLFDSFRRTFIKSQKGKFNENKRKWKTKQTKMENKINENGKQNKQKQK